MTASIYQNLNLQSDDHRMGDGYSCTFRIKGERMDCVWSPDVPEGRKLRRIVQSERYIKARHLFMTEVAKRLGRQVICVEA